MKKNYWFFTIGLGVLLILIGGVVVFFLVTQLTDQNTTNTNTVSNDNATLYQNTNITNTTTSQTNETFDLLAGMQGFSSGLGFKGDQSMEGLARESWLTFVNDASFATYLENLKTQQAVNGRLISASGMSTNRDVVGEFIWNVIEPTEGVFDWTLPDAAVLAAGEAGVETSAVVQPFSNWNSTETVPSEKCVGIDFVFMDYKGGLPKDMDKYQAFLTALVERYDGDGVDDMPGLITRVTAWEIGNEYEGPCSGNLNQPENYLTLLKASYETIKQTDPTALVLNAGALEVAGANGEDIPDTINFWQTFFDQGGADYVDIFNIHYNTERKQKKDDLSSWLKDVGFFRQLLDEAGHTTTPMWITEYGTFGGTIQEKRLNGPTETLTKTPTEQASWYFRTMITGMDQGIEKFFVDLVGPDNVGIGSSSYYVSTGRAREFSRTMVGVAQTLEGFTAVTQLEEGQFQFDLPNSTVYALWSETLPADISGTVQVVNLFGAESTQSADSLTYSEEEPILVVVNN